MNVVLYNLQDFINTLDSETIKKLCIRSLRRGIGSLDYIDSLLVMEDDLDNDNNEDDIAEAHSPSADGSITITPPPQPIPLHHSKLCCNYVTNDSHLGILETLDKDGA